MNATSALLEAEYAENITWKHLKLATALILTMAGLQNAVTDAGTGTTMQSLLGVTFITEGFIALALTVIVAIAITRDTRRIALLALPVNVLAGAIGFPTGIFVYPLGAIAATALIKDNPITNKLTQIGGWTAAQTGAAIGGAATGYARTHELIGAKEGLNAFTLGKGQYTMGERQQTKMFNMQSANADDAGERAKYNRLRNAGYTIDQIKRIRAQDTLNKASGTASHAAQEAKKNLAGFRAAANKMAKTNLNTDDLRSVPKMPKPPVTRNIPDINKGFGNKFQNRKRILG